MAKCKKNSFTQFKALFFSYLFVFYFVLPQLCHSIHKFLFGELALSGSTELPRHNQHRDAGGIQREVVTELLDPIDANLILILRIYGPEKKKSQYHVHSSVQMWNRRDLKQSHLPL